MNDTTTNKPLWIHTIFRSLLSVTHYLDSFGFASLLLRDFKLENRFMGLQGSLAVTVNRHHNFAQPGTMRRRRQRCDLRGFRMGAKFYGFIFEGIRTRVGIKEHQTRTKVLDRDLVRVPYSGNTEERFFHIRSVPDPVK